MITPCHPGCQTADDALEALALSWFSILRDTPHCQSWGGGQSVRAGQVGGDRGLCCDRSLVTWTTNHYLAVEARNVLLVIRGFSRRGGFPLDHSTPLSKPAGTMSSNGGKHSFRNRCPQRRFEAVFQVAHFALEDTTDNRSSSVRSMVNSSRRLVPAPRPGFRAIRR